MIQRLTTIDKLDLVLGKDFFDLLTLVVAMLSLEFEYMKAPLIDRFTNDARSSVVTEVIAAIIADITFGSSNMSYSRLLRVARTKNNQIDPHKMRSFGLLAV